ncbi:MAG: hypothetical protein FJ291_33240, partial [Planctomycetes bacterium]|nr:hypothetical protein [Planctomycetota bacterium]
MVRWLAMLTVALPVRFGAGETAVLRSPQGLALDKTGNLLVSCRGSNSVVVMSRAGARLREFGAERLANPGGLCIVADGRVAVANTGKNEVAVFDAKGGFAAAVGGLAGPEDVAAGADGRLYVADTGNSLIAVLDPELKGVLFSIEQVGKPPSKLKSPAGIAVTRDRLVVADTGNKRILTMPVPRSADDTARATAIAQADAAPRFVAAARDGSMYAASDREVRGFSRRGEPFASFGAKAIRVTVSYLFQPGGLAIDAKGNVLAADRGTSRVFVTNAGLLDPVPNVVVNGPTAATVEWESPVPLPTA